MSTSTSAESPAGTPHRWADPDVFREAAVAWLDEHRDEAPRDYGPILPPELADEGRAWQRRLFDAGFAGVHWPTDVVGGWLIGLAWGLLVYAAATYMQAHGGIEQQGEMERAE